MSDTSYLENLNDIQRKAVTTLEGPVMVIAGPGSGKTRVLTYRVAHLLNAGVSPWNILALTFTNKAARSMKDRIEELVGSGARNIWAGTFHSIFARILRVEAEHLGYPNNFTIYDTDDSKSLISEISKQMGLDKTNYNPGMLRSRISSAKSNLITPLRYERDAELLDEDRMARRPKFLEVYRAYVKRCQVAGAMDFDDLLLKLHELFFKHPAVLDKYRARFHYLMVDEFQDTNFLQYQIIKQLSQYDKSPENICIVGDDAQSIYGFRGATISNILDYEKDYKNVSVFKLEQNYRSTDHIVEAANQVITKNSRQIPKKIWTDSGEGSKIKILKALTDNEEGRLVVDLISEQKMRNHLKNKNIAILYRTNAQSRVFEEHLRRKNIAYKVFGGLSFYKRKEVKDLLGYLRLAINYKDNEAFKRVVNLPKRGIGATTIQKLTTFAAEQEISVWEAVDQVELKGRALKLLKEFKLLISTFIKVAAEKDAFTAAAYIYSKSGLQGMLKADITMEGINRIENVNSLLDGIKDYTDDDELEEGEDVDQDHSLAGYIQNVALLTDFDEDIQEKDYVTLMSVHSAKGLEFPSIFVVGLEENLFPSFMSMSTPDQLEEERRLFYVAITRAERHLTFSYANSRYQYGQIRYNDPSRFIEEIPDSHYDLPEGKVRSASQKSGISGVPQRINRLPQPIKIPKDFKPTASHLISTGHEVLHLKFGKGKVMKIDGNSDNRVATIFFENIDSPERRIMLKFAKLQVLNNN